ncbi:Inosine-5'-monophosphate dehydrogenase [Wickerhamomyces ciferrii]|uniref:Inosine-5'-monophosphate dehydrogenase n=1 Tax=Wickerhamomyces ciferrii (strain ATCC 14091 / BCRC 22168 / CBS 111 / JCM 3599 / NBRC 0793 / NRRL Y-1031 F-60-10) TaxID=1206466 RepID=K0KLK9_WICCF|nr:Inosine-5'-monophosphate dehydrogenase [Wickerhamomyces ciferrii]CCH46150.1 Inosine-5'-monophosphate dehydrogenase [Wickerhamomyces ciferrii]
MSDVKKKGTIYQLKPDQPCFCSAEEGVLSAAKLMLENSAHCVLVQEGNRTVGLFTAKDFAYKVVGKGIDPDSALVKDIMTTSPLFLHMNTPMTEALEIMVKRGIRHLPLLDNEENIKGVLDITRCFHQAMLRLEKISNNAKKLNQVLQEVAEDYEDSRSLQAQSIIDDIKRLMQLIEVPTLHSIVEGSKPAVYIDSHASVRVAAEMMIANSTTALIVNDGTSSPKRVIGIFTSKDICFRVLAKNYDPDTCTVARVLTTSPEFAKSNITISAALRLMFQGHFLNLPVTDVVTDEIIGIVSVLQLTYAALSQLGKKDGVDKSSFTPKTLEEVSNRLTDDETPLWDSFWRSVDKSVDDLQNLESSVSGKTSSPTHSRSQTPRQSRQASINQLMMSTSRRTSFNRRRESEDLSSTISVPTRVNRTVSSDSLIAKSLSLANKKTIYFKIKGPNHTRSHRVSITLYDGALAKDKTGLLELLKIEIKEKIGVEVEYQELYYNNRDKDELQIIQDGIQLNDSIDNSDSQDSRYVEIVVKDSSRHWFKSICSYWNFLKLKTKLLFFETSLFPSALVILSAGIFMGYTISKHN